MNELIEILTFVVLIVTLLSMGVNQMRLNRLRRDIRARQSKR